MAEPITKTMYRRKDGQPIQDLYGWVDDLEFFDDDYDRHTSVELIKEVWVLQTSEEITYPPPCVHEWDEDGECRECGAEREVVEASAPAKGSTE